MKLASCKSALNPPVVYSTDRSEAVVPVLVLLFVAFYGAICFVSCLVLFCSCVFGPFGVAITSLGEREGMWRGGRCVGGGGGVLVLLLFVRLFGLCLFDFVGFLFLLVSGKGCGL